MKELVERIKNDGRVLGEGVLKRSFITHQVDPELMEAMGNRFAEVFAEASITKVIQLKHQESLYARKIRRANDLRS